MAPVALFILSVLAHLVVLHSAEAKHCPVQFCSSAGNISFPFKSTGDPPECGLFTVDCSDPERPRIQLKGGGYWHEFQGSLASTSIFIKDRDLAGRLEKDHCNDGAFDELSLPSASPIPGVSLSTLNLTLIKCNILDKNSSPQPKDGCGNAYHTYYINSSNNNLPNPLPPRCETIQVPMRPSQPNMSSSLTAEFYLHVSAPECFQCTESKGECLVLEGKFKCAKGDKQLNLKLGVGKIVISAFKYLIVGNFRMASVALFILSVLAHHVVLHFAEYSEVEPSKHCPEHSCSDRTSPIRFPFKSMEHPTECGLFTVNCSVPTWTTIQLEEGGYWYEFQGPLSTTIFIDDNDLANRLAKNYCNDGVLDDLSLPRASPIPFVSLSTPNLTLFKCNTTLDKNSYPQLIYGCGNAYHTYYTNPSNSNLPSPPPVCTTIQVPMRPSQPNMSSSLIAEFYLKVETPDCTQCLERKGECLVEEGKFECAEGDKQLKLNLGLVGAAFVIIVLVVVCCFSWKKRIQKHQIMAGKLQSSSYTNTITNAVNTS
ncbi:hypothetical protein DVH24_007451 [Malus domestica]|uniref:Wall-associated receptor kinase galacturonan-binding domain-containing protein n=1 Tax=Malus domestica TaxID=3750 RepID=A0A498HL00_MALDO|nr:hypothetical protein DVH24_007451 [Malus domestica]